MSRPTSAFFSTTSVHETFQSDGSRIPSRNFLSEQTPVPPSSPHPVSSPAQSSFTYNYEQIKKDVFIHGAIFQSLRLKLTSESQTYSARLKLLKEYILADLLGCSAPTSEYHKKVTNSFALPTDINVRQSLQRLVNTLGNDANNKKYINLCLLCHFFRKLIKFLKY